MTAETLAPRRLHPGTLIIRFLKQIPEFVVGLPALFAVTSDARMANVLLLAGVGALFAFAVALLTWLRFRYSVGEREIVIESGVFQRQRRVIPFDRIQDIDIEQRLLARLLGLARVRIETGGSSRNEGSLDAIALADAHRLRELIRRSSPRESAAADSGAVEAAEPVLFTMDLRRLLVAGLFNFSLFFLAVIGGALQYFDPLLERYVGDPKRWILPTREQAAQYGVYVTLLLIAVLLLLGVVTGLVRTIARDYRFRLSRSPAGLRRRRGLLTLSEVLIPINRVQLAIIDTGLLRKRLGWYSLDLQTLSADAQQSGHQDAAPFARKEEIRPILDEVRLKEPPEESAFMRVSRRFVLRRFLSAILPLAAAVTFGSLFWPPAFLFLVPLIMMAAAVLLLWRRHRYALTGDALYIREGLLRPRLWILPFAKIQAIGVRRSPLQRKLGLATVDVDTAGASIFRAPAVRDLGSEAADALAADLLGRYRSARRALRESLPASI